MSIAEIVSSSLSAIAIIISSYSIFLVQFKNGKTGMTKPTLIAIDVFRNKFEMKLWLRGLLYNTSEKGIYIQNMYAKVTFEGQTTTFDQWFYSENGKDHFKGSGVYVDKKGIVNNHNFITKDYLFKPKAGKYTLQVFCVGLDSKEKEIYSTSFYLDKVMVESAERSGGIIFLDLDLATNSYIASVDIKPKPTPSIYT